MVPDEWPIASPSEDDGGYPARPAGRRRLPTVRKDFFLDPRDRLTEQERALMTAMLAELLGTIAEEIRASLPPGLAAANDEDSQQLLRELSNAGLLDHSDLIALLLRRADEERIANAIRARSSPRGGFLQALIADEDETVSATAMGLILARGRRRNRLGQPRIEFEDLSEGLATNLANAVAASLRQRVPGLISKEAHLPFGSAAAALLQSRDEGKAVDKLTSHLVKTLSQVGYLDERLLEAAAEEGDIAFLSYALGERAGIDGASSWDYLADGEDGRLVLLLRLAGLSRDFAARLLALMGDLVGIGDLGTEIGRFDALDEAKAREVSEWLRLDSGYRAALRTLGGADGDRTL
jgi:hypothetical protein